METVSQNATSNQTDVRNAKTFADMFLLASTYVLAFSYHGKYWVKMFVWVERKTVVCVFFSQPQIRYRRLKWPRNG